MSHDPSPAPDPTRDAGVIPAPGDAAIQWIDPQPGERILDLGCGDGTLAASLAEAGARVVGVDVDATMVDEARSKGVDAHRVDAHYLPYDDEFDAVVTHAALHWMLSPEAVIAGVRRSLRRGGRFVGEFGGHGNTAAIITALLAALHARGISGKARFPWFFPTAERYRGLLEAAGLRVESIELLAQPTRLPDGMASWLAHFAEPFLHGLEEEVREAVLDDAQAWLAPTLQDIHGHWTADHVRLRFKAYG